MTIIELELLENKILADIETLTYESNKREDKKPGRTYSFQLGYCTKDEKTNTYSREELIEFNDKLLDIISTLSLKLQDAQDRLEKSDNKEII